MKSKFVRFSKASVAKIFAREYRWFARKRRELNPSQTIDPETTIKLMAKAIGVSKEFNAALKAKKTTAAKKK